MPSSLLSVVAAVIISTGPTTALVCRYAYQVPLCCYLCVAVLLLPCPSSSSLSLSILSHHHSVTSSHIIPQTKQAKGLFTQLSVPAKVVECDVVEGGSELREALAEVTGRRTVPQVFIGGKHVGGCDGEHRKRDKTAGERCCG